MPGGNPRYKPVPMTVIQAKPRRRARKRQSPVVVMAAAPAARAGPRRVRRKRNRIPSAVSGGPGVVPLRLTFCTAVVKGNSSGTIVLGPECLSEAFKGVLKAFQKYRVVSLGVRWSSEASSTDRGSISYHLDSGNSMSASTLTSPTSWLIRGGGSVSYGRSVLGDQPWYESDKQQCQFVYRGSGGTDSAGKFISTVTVHLTNPK